ncbi:MAG: hypothetical protein HY908_24115 [Myxococcales bacterium]|nr:hypothetical protein [Myxococcales bacterium]
MHTQALRVLRFVSLAALALGGAGALAACPISVTDGGGGAGVVCTVGGQTYEPGQSFPSPDGCNTCTCGDDGQAACTLLGCVTCVHGGQTYQPGDVFPNANGCGTCTCEPMGTVSCTAPACSIGCEFGGPSFDLGDEVPAGDGCNTCTCAADGFGCTKMACACNPGAEFGRDYVGNSPAECAVIDFGCPPNTTYFGNDCGCGCEQAPWCPQYFGCMPGSGPGCDTAGLSELCPYSGFAL